MAQANWWESDPVVGTPAAAPAFPGVIPGRPKPVDPFKVRDQQIQETTLGLSLEDQAIARDKARREKLEWEATHNADGTPKPKPDGGLTRTQAGVVRQKLTGLRTINGQLDRVDATLKALEEDGWAGPVWGKVPLTGSMDPESAAFDKSIASLTALVRQLTRTPGEGAMSDYESRLAAMIPPARSDNKAARDEALAGIRELVRNLQMGYREMLDPEGDDPTPPAAGTKRRKYNPATGKIE